LDGATDVSVLKINPNNSFSTFYYYMVILTITIIYVLRGKNSLVFFNHFNISNFTVFVLYVFLFTSFSIFLLLKLVFKKANLAKSVDYLFSVNNLVVLLPYLFSINTVFSFLFFLELISVALLYKLISSKIWFKSHTKGNSVNNSIPQSYINMVFFQYWVTFFSTIFIVYFYINIFYLYGTSDWYIVQYLNITSLDSSRVFGFFQKLSTSIFIFSIFFKLGITPFHLFKVEIYKGIPFLSIFLYTTYYFSIFLSFFFYFLSDFIGGLTVHYYFLIITSLFVGVLYIVVLLFDVNMIKAFFTYSTVINTTGFLIAFISNI
jgi:NADH:ubiquinone oxidoreductase subunit 2 (subunit N)